MTRHIFSMLSRFTLRPARSIAVVLPLALLGGVAVSCLAGCKPPVANAASNSADAAWLKNNVGDEGVVLVKFGAEWCGPCRMVDQSIDGLRDELDGRVRFVVVDVDQSPGLAGQFGVRAIPHMVVFRNGEQVDKRVGGLGKSELKDWLLDYEVDPS